MELNIIDNILADTLFGSDSFNEFCNDIDMLESLINNTLYTEVVGNKEKTFKNTVKDIVGNTNKTIEKTGNVYHNVTDAGGAIYRGEFNIIMSAVTLISKIAVFFANKIGTVASLISKTIDNIGDIPQSIRNKIRGNITLYITVNDIDDLYNNALLAKLETFTKYMERLTKGDTWTTLFSKRGKMLDKLNNMNDNDIGLCKEMKKEFNYFSKLRFDKTVIDMSIKDNVSIYIGADKCIKFNDLKGKSHYTSYYDALDLLVKELTRYSQIINSLREDLGEKFNKSQCNQQFSKLNTHSQHIITETIQMISKFISIIANMVRYIIIDMQTVRGVYQKISQKKWKEEVNSNLSNT